MSTYKINRPVTITGNFVGTTTDISGNSSTAGVLLKGSTSGTVSILPQAVAGTYNFNLPTTAGTAGQVLTSQGGVGTAMTWTTASGTVTSVAASVPSFLNITGSPVTTSGTLAIGLSGTALDVANGGTGQITLTSNAVLLGNTTGAIQSPSTITYASSTLTLPKITSNDTTATTSNTTGAIILSGGLGISNVTDATSATNGGTITTAGGIGIAKKLFVGTTADITGNTSTAGVLVRGSTSGTISILPQATAGTFNFNLPTTAGSSGQVLTSAGGSGSPMTWTTPSSGTKFVGQWNVSTQINGISGSNGGTYTVIWNTTIVDTTGSTMNTSTGTWTCPTTGYYLITCPVTIQVNSTTGTFHNRINVGGTTKQESAGMAAVANMFNTVTSTCILNLTATNTVTIVIFNDNTNTNYSVVGPTTNTNLNIAQIG